MARYMSPLDLSGAGAILKLIEAQACWAQVGCYRTLGALRWPGSRRPSMSWLIWFISPHFNAMKSNARPRTGVYSAAPLNSSDRGRKSRRYRYSIWQLGCGSPVTWPPSTAGNSATLGRRPRCCRTFRYISSHTLLRRQNRRGQGPRPRYRGSLFVSAEPDEVLLPAVTLSHSFSQRLSRVQCSLCIVSSNMRSPR